MGVGVNGIGGWSEAFIMRALHIEADDSYEDAHY